jgi:DNA-binding CsgD family transcriptional regulator
MLGGALYPVATRRLQALGRRGQVLQGMWDGKGTKEIAAELGISPKTVEYHRAKLYRVFGVSDLVSLCRRALVGVLRVEGRSEGRPACAGLQRLVWLRE